MRYFVIQRLRGEEDMRLFIVVLILIVVIHLRIFLKTKMLSSLALSIGALLTIMSFSIIKHNMILSLILIILGVIATYIGIVAYIVLDQYMLNEINNKMKIKYGKTWWIRWLIGDIPKLDYQRLESISLKELILKSLISGVILFIFIAISWFFYKLNQILFNK